ncbi:PREDICTED: uncharacterized protein LOC108688408 [Atta colombica]|uniref:uncharacterized protein LOC108688408 n=1 Tax=Atta colombica TaxID=520822 RepID=UPI00084C0B18|nr:PREDICTED: uncharacterized protein LOC108688408 [Atta colombica]
MLHHDNAPAHTSLLVRNFFGQKQHHNHASVLCDFFLFPKLKRSMKGRRFATIEEIKTTSLEELKAISKSAYQKCFEEWKKRWHKCIISEGDYFEGDKIDSDE